ncbi:M20/M25/M40 family metallo-hydrolase [Brevundimonas sp.]|uniref:M20/M25/M40 family metallo-hydrolase n=1 Tax=Brevundimonas sp. TaxID=1871086 RepID=UPI001E05F044|nr:M20/M25/M40 family metallo-hydrolase [Brevundimonas sp.]MBL0948304.1 M20/M25/M40 family metallo-hydrolase [Brevundimonas sp.]
MSTTRPKPRARSPRGRPALGILLLVSLLMGLGLAALLTRSPAPRPADAEAARFSAGRAMVDVERLARAPRPLGTPEHAEARAYLLDRMQALGLDPVVMEGPLSPGSIRRMERWDLSPEAAGYRVRNLVGHLPGRDPTAAPVVLMAHYDSVPGSPGAADDATGVAAILESVRAIQARGPTQRTLIVLITDAEELGLDGARVFFGDYPDRARIGFVINLEARGGGGRAMMFETGPGNAGAVGLLAEVAPHVDGGVTSNSLAVAIYRMMQNDTDFSVPRDRGLAGLNFAFIGRAEQYHRPSSTPEALDRGSLQHIGSQALEVTDRLLRAESLPEAGPDRVYADAFGRAMIVMAAPWGWGLVVVSLGLLAFAAFRSRTALASLLRGAVDGVAFLAGAFVLAQAVRLAAGPMLRRVESAEVYYQLLERLPLMEVATGLALFGAALVFLAGLGGRLRLGWMGVVAVLGLMVQLIGGWDPVSAGMTGLALVAAIAVPPPAASPWPRWLGLIALVLAMGTLTQALLPEAAFLFLWPGLVAAGAAALVAGIDPELMRARIALVPLVAAVLVGAWLLAMAHPVFLGIGMDLPGILALIALLWLSLAAPLALMTPNSPGAGPWRGLAVAGLVLIVAATSVSASAPMVLPG